MIDAKTAKNLTNLIKDVQIKIKTGDCEENTNLLYIYDYIDDKIKESIRKGEYSVSIALDNLIRENYNLDEITLDSWHDKLLPEIVKHFENLGFTSFFNMQDYACAAETILRTYIYIKWEI